MNTLDSIYTLYHGAFVGESRDGGSEELVLPDGRVFSVDDLESLCIASFGSPRSVKSVAKILKKFYPNASDSDILSAIENLINLGIIVPTNTANQPLTPNNASGFFGCPCVDLDHILSGDAGKVVFLGMPYEMGITGVKGASSGPSYLRRCSRMLLDYKEDLGMAAGWWHNADKRWILEGVTFRDIGDVSVAGSLRNGVAFDRLYEATFLIGKSGRLPVLIGGDHSVSLPAIRAALSAHGPLTVLHFDAHRDLGSDEMLGDWRQDLTHGNFMS